MKRKIFLLTTIFLLSSYISIAQITIGTDTIKTTNPFKISGIGYSRVVSLLRFSEIGSFGIINSIDFDVSTTSLVSRPVKIYLTSTFNTDLTPDSWSNLVSGATLVYDGALTFQNTGWSTISINPFNYSSQNLLLLIETNYGGSGIPSGSGVFNSTSYNYNKTQYTYSDSINVANNALGSIASSTPNIRLNYNTVGISKNTPVKDNFSFYPNPAHNMITIKSTPENLGLTFNILDITGRVVSTGIIKNEYQEVFMEELKSGIYFINIDHSEILTYKVIKQ